MALAAPLPTLSQGSRPHRGEEIRLTRRGRVVVTLGVVGIGVLALMLGGRVVAQADMTLEASPAMVSVVVKPGENLWQIVQRVNPGSDPREMVLRVREINGLASSQVEAGSTLVVPAA